MKPNPKGLLGAFAMAFLLLAPLAAAPARALTGVIGDSGGTTLLGGGDYRFVRFGNDAAFGVLWGNTTNPNHIYLVAIKARYLGLVDVRTTAGATVVNDRPVRVYTVYAFKLGALVEFEDSNSDGIASYNRTVSNNNYSAYVETEPLHKMVSLNTSWAPSTVTETTPSEGVHTWSFSLTARNMTYIALPSGGTPTGVLDELTFTFHLQTTVVHVDNATVPQYAVTVERNGTRWGVTNATRDGNVTWSGDRLRYNVKWDQRIVGWDYDAGNARPGLVLELGAIVANRLPTDIGEWFGVVLIWKLGEDSSLKWREASGDGRANETSSYRTARRLTDRSVTAGGGWSQIGRLTWVSDCTVDGNPGLVYAQVQGGIAGVVRTPEGTYAGVVLLIGLSFPGGGTIVHDPNVDSEAFIVTPGGTSPVNLVGLLLGVAVLFTVVLLVVLVATRRRRKPQQQAMVGQPPQTFDPHKR